MTWSCSICGVAHEALPTVGLKTHVHVRKPGVVPAVEVEATGHPLPVEQREGMTWRRVEQLAHVILGHAAPPVTPTRQAP
jgi:hypothetical protein